MIIKIPVRYEGPNGDKVLYTLFDSGSLYSCIHPDHVKDLGEPAKFKTPIEVETAAAGSNLFINERMAVDFFIQDIHLTDEFMVVPGMTEDVIIGALTMQKWRLKLDFEHDIVVVDPRVARAILHDMKFRRVG